MSDSVNHPKHYGGADSPYECIKVIEAWGLGFCLGNAVKYISRAGKKGDHVEDLLKARWYIDRAISQAGAGHLIPQEPKSRGQHWWDLPSEREHRTYALIGKGNIPSGILIVATDGGGVSVADAVTGQAFLVTRIEFQDSLHRRVIPERWAELMRLRNEVYAGVDTDQRAGGT